MHFNARNTVYVALFVTTTLYLGEVYDLIVFYIFPKHIFRCKIQWPNPIFLRSAFTQTEIWTKLLTEKTHSSAILTG